MFYHCLAIEFLWLFALSCLCRALVQHEATLIPQFSLLVASPKPLRTQPWTNCTIKPGSGHPERGVVSAAQGQRAGVRQDKGGCERGDETAKSRGAQRAQRAQTIAQRCKAEKNQRSQTGAAKVEWFWIGAALSLLFRWKEKIDVIGITIYYHMAS